MTQIEQSPHWRIGYLQGVLSAQRYKLRALATSLRADDRNDMADMVDDWVRDVEHCLSRAGYDVPSLNYKEVADVQKG